MEELKYEQPVSYTIKTPFLFGKPLSFLTNLALTDSENMENMENLPIFVTKVNQN